MEQRNILEDCIRCNILPFRFGPLAFLFLLDTKSGGGGVDLFLLLEFCCVDFAEAAEALLSEGDNFVVAPWLFLSGALAFF